MFGELSNRESLRDVVLATQAHASKAYHLGFGRHAAKSTLADANTKRDYRIFYNDFKRLHNIESIGAYFVIRGKTNNDTVSVEHKALFHKKSGIFRVAVLQTLKTVNCLLTN